LVGAGVDITVIRSWLGHVSLDTINHYAQANLETKRKALERLADASRPSKPPPWKHDKGCLRGSIRFRDARNNVKERCMARLCTEGSYYEGDLLSIISGHETFGSYLNSSRGFLFHATGAH
jgi:hypothetical protein